MKSTVQLINNVSGQLDGIKKMINQEKSSIEVITQMKAARSGFDTVMNKYIQDEFWKVIDSCEDKQMACKKLIADLLSTIS